MWLSLPENEKKKENQSGSSIIDNAQIISKSNEKGSKRQTEAGCKQFTAFVSELYFARSVRMFAFFLVFQSNPHNGKITMHLRKRSEKDLNEREKQ